MRKDYVHYSSCWRKLTTNCPTKVIFSPLLLPVKTTTHIIFSVVVKHKRFSRPNIRERYEAIIDVRRRLPSLLYLLRPKPA